MGCFSFAGPFVGVAASLVASVPYKTLVYVRASAHSEEEQEEDERDNELLAKLMRGIRGNTARVAGRSAMVLATLAGAGRAGVRAARAEGPRTGAGVERGAAYVRGEAGQRRSMAGGKKTVDSFRSFVVERVVSASRSNRGSAGRSRARGHGCARLLGLRAAYARTESI